MSSGKTKISGNISVETPGGQEWVTATNMEFIFSTLRRCTTKGIKYRLVAGNTASGCKAVVLFTATIHTKVAYYDRIKSFIYLYESE